MYTATIHPSESNVDNRNLLSSSSGLTGAVVVLLLTLLCPHRVSAAGSGQSATSGFGWRFEYDKLGRISSMTDPAKRKTNLRYTQYQRGGLSSMTQERPSGSKIKFKFDKYGRRTEMQDDTGTVRYTYDKLGRLMKVHREGAPALSYTYDGLDRIKSLGIGSLFSLGYTYDYRGRPEKIVTPVGVIRFTYNSKASAVVRRLPNGITTQWEFGPDGRLKSIVHRSSMNRILAQYQYSYRLDGLITSIKELRPSSGVETYTYQYDKAQRLVSTSGGDAARIEYNYDRLGNRTRLRRQGQDPIAAKYDWAGRLTHYDGQICRYDASGNLAAWVGRAQAFTFDDAGLLQRVVLQHGSIKYNYDGDGYLIGRDSGTVKQTFVPDPLSDNWQPLLVKTPGAQQTYYIWEGTGPLMAVTGDKVRYFLHDHLGSVRLITDKSGQILERRNYSPFGQPEGVIPGTNLQPGFAGLVYDKAASLYLTQARAYDPELGRFLQIDPQHRTPTGSQEDLSRYPYCANDPLNYVDRTGGSRIPVGAGTMDWGSLLSDMQRRQQEMSSQQSRMMSDMQRRQQEMSSRQSRMASDMQRRQQEMSARQSRMASDMQRRQQEMSARQNRMMSDLRQRQSRMMSNRRNQPQVVGAGIQQGYNRMWRNVGKMYSLSLRASAINTGKIVIIGATPFAAGAPAVSGALALGSGALSGLAKTTRAEMSTLPGGNDVARTWGGADKVSNIMGDIVSAGTLTASYLNSASMSFHATIEGKYLDRGRGTRIFFDVDHMEDLSALSRSVPAYGYAEITTTITPRLNYSIPGMIKTTREFLGDKVLEWGAEKAITTHSPSYGGGSTGSYGSDYVKVTHTSTRRHEHFNGAAFNRAYADYEKTGVYRGPMENHHSGLMNISKPGGIRLAGADKALGHLGELEGIALDETNGRLILLGEGKSPINLPPLRLDDVVTIFRCVYLHGAAPSVTIDPISDKDTEKWMKVIHGKGTENTYVGWILYEADRIMKNYGLGKDNKTKKKIHSRIPGYRDFNAIGTYSRKRRWERFWIVPAAMTRTRGATSELTLFDLPLKLNTEKMEWDGTKLVTAKNPTPSKSAQAYTKWFTMQYDKLAKEVKLAAPKHFGIDKPVAIFEELKRIALISGIAETLRDQNVPFPTWMYDYPVKPCISDSQTPRIKVTGEGYEVHGGVQLSPIARNIKDVTNVTDITRLTKTVHKKMATKPLFAPVTFQQKGKTYKAVTLPGTDTQRGGANMLQHADVTAAVLQEAGIQLTRQFNSFYDPRSLFGRGWTLDLPRLRAQQQPVNRTETTVGYKTAYQLTSPLNSWSERFAEIRTVPELNQQLMVPGKSGSMLGLADASHPTTGQQTKVLFFRDGTRWHFDPDGYLVARSNADTMVLYQRDPQHKISSVKSFVLQGSRIAEGEPKAELHLTYDDKDKYVRSLEARSPELDKPIKALYIYDDKGHLSMVLGPNGTTKYTYRDGLVTSITHADEKLASFAYNEEGQIQQESRGNGRDVAYQRINTSFGTKVVALDANSRQPIETVEYDANLIPRGRTFEDGSKVAWRQQDKALETTVTDPDGEGYTLTESNDGRQSTVKTTTGVTYTSDFDTEGRLTRAHLEGGPTLEQTWHSDGRLQAAISDDQGILPRYTSDGKLSSIVIAPPDQARTGQPRQYVKTNYDAQGRITRIVDDAGSQLQIDYDRSGQPALIQSPQGSVQINRDPQGQVREVSTSWGLTETYDYDKATGDITRITLQQQTGTSTERARIELTEGQISKIHQPDGGETTFNYYQNEKQKGLLKEVRTSEKLALAYSYDKDTRLKGIDIGEGDKPVYRINYVYDEKGRLAGVSYRPVSVK